MKFIASIITLLAIAVESEARFGAYGRGRGRGGGLGDVEFTDIGCTNADTLPACVDRKGTAGVWICRTRPDSPDDEDEDDEMKTMCVSPERTIEGTDACGICEGEELPVVASCPETCDCEMTDDETGVTSTGINVTFSRRGRTKTKCLSVERATTVLATKSSASCCTV